MINTFNNILISMKLFSIIFMSINHCCLKTFVGDLSDSKVIRIQRNKLLIKSLCYGTKEIVQFVKFLHKDLSFILSIDTESRHGESPTEEMGM